MIKIVKWLNAILVLGTLLSFLAPSINPEKFWPLAVFGLLFPILVVLNLFFIIYWGLKKNIFGFVSLIAVIIGFNGVKGVINFGGKNKESGRSILIGTYNIGGLNRLDPKSKEYLNLSENDLRAFFENHKIPDIISFQEITPKNRKTIQSVINLPYFYQHTSLNTCIFSKFPITNSGSIIFEKSFNSAIWTDVDIDGNKFRVFDVHLQSNTVKSLTDKTLSSNELEASKKYRSVLKIFSRIKNATLLRVQQAKQVKALIRKSPYPVLVCGDLNDSSQSYVYATISENLKDSFKESAFGFGSTHNGKMPLLRIDYIFADNNMSVVSHKVERSLISDHNPVFSLISLNKK
ncbi:MAG: endonuclease/exonuclease/phosphatase family protein [Saprospiraceae bacterium]|nr:endonuclease/exonuclease/phosphatase family protein [Saprospiraceae bacterium]